jgi:parvulin-like peptidyl-prolyl isomerase
MKASSLLLVLGASLGLAQAPVPVSANKPDAVIVIFGDGSKMTQAEFEALLPVLPQQYQKMAEQDPQHFLKVYALFKTAAAQAESQKLGEKAPYKQGVDFAVTMALAQAEYLEAAGAMTVTPEEIEKYYNEHKEPFRRIKVSGIKVAFGAPEPAADGNSSTVNASRIPKQVLTEEEAKAKAEKLVAQLRAGADFAKLVQTESDDEASKAKGGDLGVWKMTDNVPDLLRGAVLGLKEGEVSDPIRQPGGYYIVHADAVTYAPLAEVKDVLFDQLKQEKASHWLENLDKNTKVEFPKNDQPPPPSDSKK